MKKTIIMILAFMLVISGCAQVDESQPAMPGGEISAQEFCETAGGVWKQMPDACADRCGTEDMMCAQVLTYGCYCGEGMCWDGTKCMPEEDDSIEITEKDNQTGGEL